MTFLQQEVFGETSYQWNIISKTLESGRESRKTGSKHDGIEARRENPKLDKNHNFGIIQVFDEAEGSGNIYRQVMQPDIWEEWWRPACVLDMQPAMWSTRCHRACVRSHAKRHTDCHQPEADWLLYSINRHDLPSVSTHPDLSKPTPREGSVQLKFNQMKISSDGNQVNVAREKEREKQSGRLRVPSRQLSSFDDQVEVMSRVSSVPRFQISRTEVLSKSRSVQSSPVETFILGFGQVLSDQPAASRLEHWIFGHIGRSPSCDVGITGPMPYRQVIIGRAEHGSDITERRHEVAPNYLSKRPRWSDPEKSLAISSRWKPKTNPERPIRATTPGRSRSPERLGQSDTPRSLAFLSRYDNTMEPHKKSK
ncbi:hypothetical protein F2Q68_00010032 [Brassica cretica]|uniref:Uncharacterized protein n=1 Tax=Brassica cretica TaxID=69181 RepID=A0A8S9KZG0_BRACR|nr:hypothetical protein F2Q68_00010032 [Brassica cretica]